MVNDVEFLANGLSRSLRQAGFAVNDLVSGRSADNAPGLDEFDPAILDLGLRGGPGLEVVRRLRARQSGVPVLSLTATGSVEQQVRVLDTGADDSTAKPFVMSEHEARVCAYPAAYGPRNVADRARGHCVQPRWEHRTTLRANAGTFGA
jgi:DNA-binding response OmpR family regulator